MKFSVITINYNNAAGLEKTILSVINQDYDDFEYIVIDGGSTDGSVEIIKKYSDRIAYEVSEKDNGVYHAMNKGVAQAHGDYCIFMNSGDCFYDKKVLRSVVIDGEDVIVGQAVIKDDRIISPPPRGELTLYHLYSGSIPHQAAFIRRQLLKKYPYDESLRISSDWKFFVQVLILDNGSISYTDLKVAFYDTNGISAQSPELMWSEKEKYLESVLPQRVLADYKRMKQSECLTQALTPQLRQSYRLDKFLYRIGRCLLKWRKRDEE